MKKYQFITIAQNDGEVFLDHPVYRIENNKSGSELGLLSYYKPWRQYIFTQTESGVVFNSGCLRDILDFMENHAGKQPAPARGEGEGRP